MHAFGDCNVVEIFPNVDNAARIFKSIAVSNCSSERSFSCLKRVKTFLRSTMTEDRLNDLAVLTIESEWAKSVSFEETVSAFCDRRLRRKV